MQVLFEFFGGNVHLRILPANICLQRDGVGYRSGNKLSSDTVNIINRRVQFGEGIVDSVEHSRHHIGVYVIGGGIGYIILEQSVLYLVGREYPSGEDKSCAVAVLLCRRDGYTHRLGNGGGIGLLCGGIHRQRENLPIKLCNKVFAHKIGEICDTEHAFSVSE